MVVGSELERRHPRRSLSTDALAAGYYHDLPASVTRLRKRRREARCLVVDADSRVR
jgi:hypothetical protein